MTTRTTQTRTTQTPIGNYEVTQLSQLASDKLIKAHNERLNKHEKRNASMGANRTLMTDKRAFFV